MLVVASALNSEPYEQATSTSQIGFTVELLRLMGERAGLDVQFVKAVNHKDADQNITPGRPEDVAAKVAAGNETLLTTVNEALAALRADGSYDACTIPGSATPASPTRLPHRARRARGTLPKLCRTPPGPSAFAPSFAPLAARLSNRW
ncbi:hypothetical protein [Adlercreutzia caecimuris]|uniref:Uncharacterized protein n=1 Tax=Adlercreutzia caecimuris TaxID=671266 RepID=A0A4S4G544_9ACTN|nr:hypothetical protein [Adlercreutzia caecimuris]NBJ65864.1 hypothetical protein [Adlercreutzia caecimuris]THG38770.1 hypothetical protein E5986_00270 [Adlercreutzia caecimuris]